MRLFSVISRTLIERFLPLCREGVGVFYSLSRLGKLLDCSTQGTTSICYWSCAPLSCRGSLLMRWVESSADKKHLCLFWGWGTITVCLHVSGKILLVQMLLKTFNRHLKDSSNSFLRNSLRISSGPTAMLWDLWMESTCSVRVNGLLWGLWMKSTCWMVCCKLRSFC